MQRYLVSVFLNGRCVHSYFSDNLDDLVTIMAMYRRCGLSIFDFTVFRSLSYGEIADEVAASRMRWKKSLERQKEKETPPAAEEEKEPLPNKPQKKWKLPVMCVETGQVFKSLTECSNHIGLPYMTIMNCIKNKNATRGLHFMVVEPEDK